MDNEQDQVPDLWTLASHISTPAEADTFFYRLRHEAKSSDVIGARALLHTGIGNLMERTKFDSEQGGEIIEKHILPRCFEQDALLSPELLDSRGARDILSNWLEQYSDAVRIPLRARILHQIAAVLDTTPSIAAIATLGAVGVRSPWTERILRRFIAKGGPLADAAIGSLGALSPSKALKLRLITMVLKRDPHGLTTNFDYAIQELASPKFIPMLRARALRDREDAWRTSFLLGRISDRAPGDPKLQTRVWKVFEAALNKSAKMRRQWLSMGNTIANCNTGSVVRTLLQSIEKPEPGSHTIANHFRDCFRPEQLTGWRPKNKTILKAALAKYATLPGSLTRSITVEDYRRRSAWETAFCAGISDISDWLFGADPNSPIAVADTLTYSSFVVLTNWPFFVTRLVTEQIDVGKGVDPWLSARLAAMKMLAATESLEALDILSVCGVMGAGAPLRSTSELIGDLVERLSLGHLATVLERLFGICEDRSLGGNRMLGIVGLQRLAAADLMPSESVDRVLSLAHDDSLPHYAMAAVIWTTARFKITKTRATVVERLVHYVRDLETPEEVRFQSLQALIHLDIWEDHQHAILRALGLHPDTARIDASHVRSYRGWQAYALGLLARRAPDMFLDAAKQVLDDGDGQAVHLLLAALDTGESAQEDVLVELGRSAIRRSIRVLALSFGETDNFAMIARLVPSDFLRVRWEELWGDWMPQVRSALADALRQISNPDGNGATRIFGLLEGLLSDSTYAVRRSAARVYSRIDSDQLFRLCKRWMRSGETDLRIRCAECAEWLQVDDHKILDNTILRTLLEDPEPSVRIVAKRSLAGLRTREWRAVALDKVVSGGRDHSQQWVSNSYCYGRALVSLGDDETIKSLQKLGGDWSTPVNVRNWLRNLTEDVTNHWREVIQKWPEPLLAWSGQIEELPAEFSVDGHRFKSTISLWLRRQENPTDSTSWGGGFALSSLEERMQIVLEPRLEPARLTIDGRQPVRIWFDGSRDGGLFFVGTGPYPHPLDAG
jgi:hypothetical protein